MKKTEWKEQLFDVFNMPVEDLSYEEKIELAERYFVEYQKKNDEQRKRFNRGKPWTDDELRIILQAAPTVDNCIKFSKIFGRSYGSIEQIYRWASTDDKEIDRKRPDDKFIAQVKRIAKELRWRA